MFVQIKVDKDPFFERDGADVHVKVRSMGGVPYWWPCALLCVFCVRCLVCVVM